MPPSTVALKKIDPTFLKMLSEPTPDDLEGSFCLKPEKEISEFVQGYILSILDCPAKQHTNAIREIANTFGITTTTSTVVTRFCFFKKETSIPASSTEIYKRMHESPLPFIQAVPQYVMMSHMRQQTISRKNTSSPTPPHTVTRPSKEIPMHLVRTRPPPEDRPVSRVNSSPLPTWKPFLDQNPPARLFPSPSARSYHSPSSRKKAYEESVDLDRILGILSKIQKCLPEIFKPETLKECCFLSLSYKELSDYIAFIDKHVQKAYDTCRESKSSTFSLQEDLNLLCSEDLEFQSSFTEKEGRKPSRCINDLVGILCYLSPFFSISSVEKKAALHKSFPKMQLFDLIPIVVQTFCNVTNSLSNILIQNDGEPIPFQNIYPKPFPQFISPILLIDIFKVHCCLKNHCLTIKLPESGMPDIRIDPYYWLLFTSCYTKELVSKKINTLTIQIKITPKGTVLKITDPSSASQDIPINKASLPYQYLEQLNGSIIRDQEENFFSIPISDNFLPGLVT